MSKYCKFFLVLSFFFIGAAPALADTVIYGPIADDTHLTLAESPYTLSATTTILQINAGTTLTIEAGAEITGDMEVLGSLVVAGATSSPVIINGTVFGNGTSVTTINNAVINGSALAFGSSLQLSNVVINVVPSDFNGGYPVYVDGSDFVHASTTITGSSTHKGFTVNLAGMTQDQTWTNDNDTPYIIDAGTFLPSGIHLTVQPGVIVKVLQVGGYDGGRIANYGVIDIQGSTSSPVYVTSIKDDSVGGDTNGDGSAASPAPGDWVGFINNSGSMSLDHAVLTYSTHVLIGDNFTGSNSRIASSLYAALAASNSTFTIMELVGNGVGIGNCGNLTIHNSTIAGNASGVVCYEHASSTLTNNWWGDASGPYNATFNPTGLGDSVDGDLSLYYPWVGASTTCSANCNSNVMFLPGIEASRLYVPGLLTENKIWEPNSVTGHDVANLDMTDVSAANTVYTKEKSIIDTAYNGLPFVSSGYDVYSSLIAEMNALATGTTPLINEWQPIVYDWRLDYDILLAMGNKVGEKIYYRGTNAATSTPYIIQELQRLASSSRTGKVTIVAHSNGGLLAKALTNALGTTTTSLLIDKIVMVATPQLGTPQAIIGLLHGTNQALPLEWLPIFASNADARYLGQSMPAAYNLLPSSEYFNDVLNPVITFDQATLPWWAAEYGSSIGSTNQLRDFMTDSARPIPQYYDLKKPNIASSTLFDNAQTVHDNLDNWTPPSGVQLTTIAGWGKPTLRTINYKKQPQLVFGVPVNATTTGLIMAIDGDGTVVDASAQWASEISGTRYWINLLDLNTASSSNIKHDNIFTAKPLQDLLVSIISNASTSTLPQYVTNTRPSYTGTDPRIYFTLHSPLTLGFTDSSGNYTGSTATTTVFNAPGVDYERFGEVQWLSVPTSLAGQVRMQGTGSGSFALDIESVNGNSVLATTTFAAVPVATSTIATLTLTATTSPTASSTLLVDSDGNGTNDITIRSKQGSMVLSPAVTVATTTSTTTVAATYANLPTNSHIVVVNASTQALTTKRVILPQGGSGTTTVSVAGLASGTYYLLARDSVSSTFYAHSTNFSI